MVFRIVFGALALLAFGMAAYNLLPSIGGSGGPSGYSHEQMETFKQGLIVGQRGSELTNVLSDTCNLIGTTAISASSTTSYDCAVVGVKPGDEVFVTPPTTFPFAPNLGYDVVEAHASSTPGYITVTILNLTGTATSSASVTLRNNWQYFAVR